MVTTTRAAGAGTAPSVAAGGALVVAGAKPATAHDHPVTLDSVVFRAPTAPQIEAIESNDDEIETDRPDYTETASTVGRGRVQIESGQTYTREAGVKNLSFGEALIRIGLTERIELRINANSYSMSNDGTSVVTGFLDPTIGAKLGVIREQHGWIPQLALIASVSVPMGSSAWRSNKNLPEAKISTRWDFTDRVGLGTNWNWSLEDEGTHTSQVLAGAGSLGISLTDKLGFYSELMGFRNESSAWSLRTYLAGGFTYLMLPGVQLDIRAGRGVSGAPGAFFTGIGLSRKW